MLRRLLVAGGLLAVTPQVMAEGLDLSLRDDSAQLRFFAPLEITEGGRSEYDVGFLYADREPDNSLFSAGIHMIGQAGTDAPGLEFGVGVKGFVGEAVDFDIGAITVGASGRYAPPAFNRFFVQAGVNYAPKIVSFGDADRFAAVNVRVGYELLPDADIYLGYRDIEADIEGGPEVEVDEGGHLGVMFNF